MAKTRPPSGSRQAKPHKKRNRQTHQTTHPHQTKTPPSHDPPPGPPPVPRVRAPTLAAAPATPAPAWLGPRAPWHTDRTARRVDQPRHATPPPDETACTARLHEYLDRDDGAAHIPPRVYHTVLDTVRTPARTTFARYGWVHTFAEYDAYAAANPGKYAYELWFGHRGLARASLDARQALIRGAAAAYSDRGTLGSYAAEADAVAMPDDEAMTADGAHGAAATVADYADDGYDDDELPFPMDPDEGNEEVAVVEEGATDGAGLAMGDVAALAPPCPPQLLLDCADDDTF